MASARTWASLARGAGFHLRCSRRGESTLRSAIEAAPVFASASASALQRSSGSTAVARAKTVQGGSSAFEGAVVVPLPGMLLTRDLFRGTHLYDAFAGRVAGVDIELGEAAILSTASIKEAAQFVIAGLKQHHNGAAAILVGHSYGGYVALEIARQAPVHLAGLVLMSTQNRADTTGAAARREKQVSLAQSAGMTALIDGILPALLSSDAQKDAELVDTVRQMAEHTGVRHFAQQMRACSSRADQRSTIQELDPRIPVLVVAGARDKLIPPRCAQEFALELKAREEAAAARCCPLAPWGVRSHPESGHLLALEQPEAFHCYLASWADEVYSSAHELGRPAV